MKKVLSFVKGKKEERKEIKVNPPISVEITNPSGQKITSDDEHIIGLQQASGYNIDVNGKDKTLSKIHKAAWFGNLEKVKLYSKKIDVNSVDWNNRTCLHLAVAQGHTEVAWYLLNNNASMTICDNDGLNPFLKAIECGHKDCTNLLIECGVDVKLSDKHGNSGLHFAAKAGFYNIAALLLKEGANFNTPNNAGDYPLHLCTSFDHREMVELLIRNGANVDVVDREGRTSLMLAARSGLSTIIKVLLDAEASLEIVDSNGWTAEDYAQFGNHHDLAELLKIQKKIEVILDHSDKLSVQSSDPSETFEGVPGQGNIGDEIPDSPRSCITPPPLEPPRSWDLIQSGVIDQDGADARRRSFITLGTLKRESTGGSCDLPITANAEITPSALTPRSDCIPVEMRLSPEPLARDRVPTPERRTRSPLERANSLDLPSDQDSPGIGTPDKILTPSTFIEITSSPVKDSPENNLYDSEITSHWNTENNNNITLDKLDNVIKPIEFGTNINEKSPPSPTPNIYMTFGEIDKVNIEFSQNCASNIKQSEFDGKQLDDRSYTIEYSQSYDNLDERSLCTDNAFTGVSSSLDNLDDIEDKSLSIEIIQSTGKLDDTLAVCTFPTKSKFRETHSLELLEEVVDIKSLKNKRHSRNKSITLQGQPQFWRSADVIVKSSSFEKCTNIDAQLECYDEALRQLAKVNMPKAMPPKSEESNIKLSHNFVNDIPFLPKESNYHPEDNTFPQVHDIEPISLDFPPEVLENEPDSLDVEKETSFPPPPTYFMESEDNEIVHINTVEACLQTIDINLPLPISMLTPIKENHFESDSLSNMEVHDGDESESSMAENDMAPRKCSATPGHFNVEVIVNNKSGEASPESISTPVNKSPDVNYLKSNSYDTSNYYDDSDDVFLQDGNLPDQYHKYLVDVRALQIHPDTIDFTKVMIPADTPSPPEKSPDEVNNSPVDKEIPTNKFPSLNFDIGGICNIKNSSSFVRIEKSESGETEGVGRPLRRKRKLLLAMRDVEGPETTECGVQMDTTENEDEEDSDEDPPFWQSTDKGGYFIRQNTVIPINPALLKADMIDASTPGTSKISQGVISSPPGSSEAETASASDTPKRSPKLQKGMFHNYLIEATVEKGKLEEKAASLLGTAERLQYELEDSRQAEAAREDTIAVLQTQLTKDKSEVYRDLSMYLECSVLSKTKSLENPKIPVNISIDNIHLMLKHLEEEKKVEEEKNRRLVQHLEEVLITNQNMITEREALIAQNIADVRKLQEDTICWKERYEECAAKLEMMDKRQDPRLLEAQDTIATLKRTIAILQQEKTAHPKYYDVSTSTASPRKFLGSTDSDGIDKSCSEIALGALQNELSACRKLLETYAVEKSENKKNSESSKVSDIEQKLKIEIAKREILENQVKRLLSEVQQRIDTGHLDSIQQKLVKDFVSRKEIEEIKSLHGEALEKVRQEVISESESKLSAKLAEINALIQGQMQEQIKLEKMRENSEFSIKQQFENISSTLQTELGKIQSALKEKEAEERLFRSKFGELETELKKNLEPKQNSEDYQSDLSQSYEDTENKLLISPTFKKKDTTIKMYPQQKEEINILKKCEERKEKEVLQSETLEEKLSEELKLKYIKKF
nr:uncharacterized protein LOC106678955 isoform X2 [Halyomorpha halys]